MKLYLELLVSIFILTTLSCSYSEIEDRRTAGRNADSNLPLVKSPEEAETKSSFWPISVRVHAELENTDPMDRKSFKPVVSSQVAHLIYSYNLMVDDSRLIDPTSTDFTAEKLRELILKVSKNQEVPQENIQNNLDRIKGTGDFLRKFLEHNDSVGGFGKPRTAVASDLLHQQLGACKTNYSEKACCKSFFGPWMLGKGEYIPSSSNFEYSLVTTKAWLTSCAHVIVGVPDTVKSFKQKYGDYETNLNDDWTVELHPISLAKKSGRRVFRKKSQTSEGFNVSVSHTLTEACKVEETEVIIGRPNRQAIFLSYDSYGELTPFGIFPGARDKRAIKLTPESCMGCHYRFDTRKFDVIVPSRKALNLYFGPYTRNDVGCKTNAESIIWHDGSRK